MTKLESSIALPGEKGKEKDKGKYKGERHGQVLQDALRPLAPLANRGLKWFRGWLVLKAHRLWNYSTVGLRVIQQKKTGHVPYV